MDTTNATTDDVQSTAGNRRVSTDLVIGLTLLGVAIAGKLLLTVSDGGILAALGAR